MDGSERIHDADVGFEFGIGEGRTLTDQVAAQCPSGSVDLPLGVRQVVGHHRNLSGTG